MRALLDKDLTLTQGVVLSHQSPSLRFPAWTNGMLKHIPATRGELDPPPPTKGLEDIFFDFDPFDIAHLVTIVVSPATIVKLS
ncbi:MAG: hypothetical protein R3330_14215 [Saprospiraceae bacterium]|nr:hypothetical protein [Saprospiraceae bacterium]